MPYFRWILQEINQHNQTHQRGIIRTTKPYCTACYLLLPNHLIPEGFINFWNWFQQEFRAKTYTTYTIVTFRLFEELFTDQNPDYRNNWLPELIIKLLISIRYQNSRSLQWKTIT